MNYGQYVGIPFVDAGRTKAGCDCWGLVRIVLQEQFGKTLPLWNDYEIASGDEGEREVELGLREGPFTRVEQPQSGDIALMRIFGKLCHVGLYLGNGEILHTSRGTDSVIEKIDGMRQLHGKIEGYYRVG